MASKKANSTATANSARTGKRGKPNEPVQDRSAEAVEAQTELLTPVEAGPSAIIPADIQTWLQEAQAAWEKKQAEDERLAREEENGSRTIYLADASMAGNTMTDAAPILLAQNDAAAKDEEGERKAAVLTQEGDNQFNPAWLGLGLLGLAAGGGGGGGGGGAVANVVNNVVSGSVVLGPVLPGHGLTVNVYAADGTTLLGTSVVTAAGTFSVNVGSYTGVVIAKLADVSGGADFMDEVTASARDLTANLMTVGVATTGTITLNINALTTIAAEKAGAVFGGASAGTITADVANNANAAVADAFGLTDLTGATIVTTVDSAGDPNAAYNPADGLSDAEKYGAVLAALSGVDSLNAGDMQQTIDDLVAGITVTGSTGSIDQTALDVVIAGANEVAVAGTANGTGGTLITAVVSDLTQQVSASVAILDVSTDNVINDTETATVSGTNSVGATVTLTIGGVSGIPVIADTAATWHYDLTPTDLVNMGVGGETIIATATLPDSSTAVASRSIVQVQDLSLYHEPAAFAPTLMSASRDEVTDITVISSLADASLDVTPDTAGTVTLSSSIISVTAVSRELSAMLDIQSAAGTVAELNVTASNFSADAGANIVTGGALTISQIDIEASASGSGDSSASVTISGGVTLGDFITITASGQSAEASFSTSSNSGDAVVFTDVTNGVTVEATGDESSASMAVYNAAGTISSLAVTASGVSSDASVSIDTDGVLTIGLIDVLSSGVATNPSNDSSASVSISGDVTLGDFITVTASGQSADASFSTNSNDAVVFTNVTNGVAVTASGNSSTAAMDVYNASGTISSLTVDASAVSSDASVNIDANGSLTIGQVDIEASATGSGDSSASVSISGDVTLGDFITVTASGQSADASFSTNSNDAVVFTNVTNGITVEATSADSSASMAVYNAAGTVSAINVTTSGNSSSAELEIYGDGTNNITITDSVSVTATAQDGSSDVTLGSQGDVGVVFSTATINVEASGNYSYASIEINEASGTLDSIVVTASGESADAGLDLYRSSVDASVLTIGSTLTVSAISNDAHAGVDLNTIVFNNTAVSVTASAVSADAELDVRGATGTIVSITVDDSANGGESYDLAEADINGQITISDTINVTASGDDNNNYSGDAILNLSGDVFLDGVVLTVTASGNSAEASVDIVNGHGTLSSITVEASADYAVANVAISHEVGTPTLNVGNINVIAIGTSADAFLELEGYEGVHQQQTLTVPGAGTVAAGVYTLTVGGMTVSYEMLASGSGSDSELFEGLRDAMELVYGNTHLPCEYLYTGSGVAVLQWNDYADHAANLISLTGPNSLNLTSVVSQVALAQSDIHLNNSIITITGTGSSAEADLTITNATGAIESITVSHTITGGGESAAGATINGTFTIGDMSVTSSGGSAELDLGNYADDTVITLAADGIDIVVTAGIAVDNNNGDYALASLYAENVHGTINTISVVTTGNSGDVSARINGNFTVAEDLLEVHAIGGSAEAHLSMYGSGSTDLTNYDVTLTDMDISLLASGLYSGASIDLADTTGTIGTITVVASAQSADASASIDFSGNLSGNITVTASGTETSADLYMTAGTPTNVTVSWEDDYSGINPPAPFASGQVFTLTVGATVLSYTLLAGDVVSGNDTTIMTNLVSGLNAAALSANADFQVLHGNNNAGYSNLFQIMWNDATAINRDDISLTCDGINLREHGFGTDYRTDHDGTVITLTSAINITATASGAHSSADIVLDNLVGNINTITAIANGGNLVSTANYYHDAFDNGSSDFAGASAEVVVRVDGSVSNIVITATNIEDRALVAVSQTVQGGTATVSGDGRTALHLGDATVDTVNLAALHTGTWGAFDLNLAMADADLGAADAAALTASLITINDFNGDRDSINLFSPYDTTTNSWAWNYSNTAMNYSENNVDAGTFGAFLAAAEVVLDGNTDAMPDYYFGVVGTDGYLAYDMGGMGITGVLKLAGVTSFDAANVGDHDHYMQLGSTSGNGTDITLNDATRIEYSTTNVMNASDLGIDYQSAGLIDFVSAHANAAYAGGALDSVSLTLTESTGDIIFRQAIVAVSADSGFYNNFNTQSADATLTVSDARGTIERVVVHAYGWDDDSTAIANFYSFNGAVNEIDIVAGGDGLDDAYAVLNMGTSTLTESVQNLWMTVESADATASLNFASGYVVKTEVAIDSSNDVSVVTLDIEQTVHGGEVFATSSVGDYIYSTDTTYSGAYATFDLTYTGATADKVSLGQMVWDNATSADVFTVGNFEGAFKLTVNVADADLDGTNTGNQATLIANMLTIDGFDTGGTALDPNDAWLDDTLSIIGTTSGTDHLAINTVDAGSMDSLLTAADTALDTDRVYFGVVGSNGYLAYDQDGNGITGVIEFLGMTDLDYTRITGMTS